MTTQALLTLRQLHGELAGKITDNKKESERLHAATLQVEAVMKLMDPACDLRSVAVHRKKHNPWFKRGTIFRTALGVLREAKEPMSAAEITKAMLDKKGVKDPDRDMARELIGAVQGSLTNNKGKTVEGVGHHPVRWVLKP